MNVGVGGDTVRTIDKAAVKTTVVTIDQGGSGAESLIGAAAPLKVRLHDGTTAGVVNTDGSQAVRDLGNPTVGSFVKTVTTAATRVQCPANACKRAILSVLPGNTGLIYVGDVTVSAAVGFRLGIPAAATPVMPIELHISNTNLIYLDCSVNGEGVSVYWEN